MMVFNGRTRSESTTVLYACILFERKAVVRLPFYSVVDLYLYIYLSISRAFQYVRFTTLAAASRTT